MELLQLDTTYLSLANHSGKIENKMVFVVARSGYGKGLASESMIEEYHNAGYIVLNIADPKDEFELAFAEFEPKEDYHLNHLKIIGKKPQKRPVKVYHPFTFELPKAKLPPFTFYTFSLKELGHSDWSMLAETGSETDTIRLLKNASHNISKKDGIYGFLHYIQSIIKGNTIQKRVKYDPKNFFLSSTSGTIKSLQLISTYMQPFKHHYFLSSDDNPLKLNWAEILNDQKHYHVFSTKWIKDPKLKEFVILVLLNKIIENKDLLTRPLVLFIPEVRFLTPHKPEGYKKYLAFEIKDKLSTIRSQGRGMSAIMDTQVYYKVDEDVRNSPTVTLFGELGGADDIEKVAKTRGYKRDIKDQLNKMTLKNSYLVTGYESFGAFKLWFPSHMHCEENYNYLEMYKEIYPERMKSPMELVNKMRSQLKEEEIKFKEIVKEQEKREQERRENEKKEREESTQRFQKLNQVKEKAQKEKDKTRQEKMKLIYEYSIENPDLSNRKIGEKFGVDHKTVAKYKRDYENALKEKEVIEENIDFENKVIDELQSDELNSNVSEE